METTKRRTTKLWPDCGVEMAGLLNIFIFTRHSEQLRT
jgi:hypothetical protein